jgi:signal transduction histidine kinase
VATPQPETVYSFERAYRREKRARQQAEALLERRSRELFEAKQRIESQYENLQAAHRKLTLAQAQLVQSEKMASVGQLAAGIAHEINNPIAFVASNLNSFEKCLDSMCEVVSAYDSVVKATGEQEARHVAALESTLAQVDVNFLVQDMRDIINESREGTRRVSDIVIGLKNFSRLDDDDRNKADINEGLRATLKIAWNEIKYRCQVETDYGEIPKIECNAGHLNQVFLNLIMNAVQACEGDGLIEIRTRAVDDALQIEIKDNGSGIDQSDMSAIFNPFFTTKEVGQGTGLGLSISYAIVEQHGGSILVDSVVGRGTTFTVVLPIDPPKAAAE